MDHQCLHEGRLSALEHQGESLGKTLEKFEIKLDMILSQISKVAVLEQAHQHHDQAIGRVFVKIGEMEAEYSAQIKEMAQAVRALEAFSNDARGMARMAQLLWGVLGSAVVGIIVRLAFFHQ